MSSNVVHLPPQGDALLVARARAGDEQAFRQLFERHTALVVRLLSRILGSDSEVPDLAHEVFLIAYRRLHVVVDSQRFGAFLTGLCVNVARNHLRSRRRRRWLVFGAAAETEDAHEPVVADGSDGREALRATYAVLETMPEQLRVCFALRFIEGRELSGVAEACGVSLATSKRWLERAESQFLKAAVNHPALASWVRDGARWGGVA